MKRQTPQPHFTRYLLPTDSSFERYPLGGEFIRLPETVGVITTPGHRSIPRGIREGRPFAVDNEVYAGHYDFRTFFNQYLPRLGPYRDQCLFVVVPDVVGNVELTLWNFEQLVTGVLNLEFPAAFVAQNGQEALPLPCPDLWEWLFVGGTDEWKFSAGAAQCIARAKALKKRVHIGRVNSRKRFEICQRLGADSVDGTALIYARDLYTERILQWTAQPALPLPLAEHALAVTAWEGWPARAAGNLPRHARPCPPDHHSAESRRGTCCST